MATVAALLTRPRGGGAGRRRVGAQGADVVVHEATNAWIPQLDDDKTEMEVRRDTIRHGHSTPHMAGAFARAANAKKCARAAPA